MGGGGGRVGNRLKVHKIGMETINKWELVFIQA